MKELLMHKKRTIASFSVFIALTLVIILTAGMSFAKDAGVPYTSGLQSFVASGKLPPGIMKKIAETGQAEIIVTLDDSDAKTAASQMRGARKMKYDDASIVSKKARYYKQKKEKVLSELSPGDYSLLEDYEKLPVMFLKSNEKSINKLMKSGDVTSIDENATVSPSLTESLPLIGATPALAWSKATGTDTFVAVLDTGIDYSLADFGSCSAPGAPASCRVTDVQCFGTGGCTTSVDHGTNVSGIVAALAPETKLFALNVFRTNDLAYYNDILSALEWVLAKKTDPVTPYNIVAVNMSLSSGGYTAPCPSDGLSSAISALKSAGIATSVASGNSGYTNALSRPACVPDAISVGAVYDSDMGGIYWSGCTDLTTAADKVTCFSNSATFLTMLAPGAIIDAAGISMGGTSQAAPHIAGSVAVIKSQTPTLSVDDVIARLKGTGVPVTDTRNSIVKPRVDLDAAVSVTDPIILVQPSDFSFMAAQGGVDPVKQTLDILNSGAGTINWSVASDAGWLTVAPDSYAGSGSTVLSVSTSVPSVLTAGTYNATLTVSDAAAVNTPVFVPVSLEVIDASYSEDYETGDLTKFPWVTAGDGVWTVENTTVHTGGFAAQSPILTDNQSSYLQVILNVTSPGYLYFWVKTSTEPDWDKIMFYVDDLNEGLWNGWSGETDWTFVRSEHEVSAGIHTFKWIFSKDVNTSSGSDTVWLDDIFFPPVNTQVPYPSVGPLSKDFGNVLVNDTSAAQTFTVSNTGTGDLVVGTVALTGTYASQFAIQNDNCSGQTVATAGDCTVDVSFTPLSTGAKSATLYIPSNYPVAATAPLSGTGAVQYTLTVNKNNSTGTGRVTSSPAGIDCASGCAAASAYFIQDTPVTLTAEADASSTFAGWSGGGCSGVGTCDITMNSITTVTALFDLKPPVADFSGVPFSGEAPLYVNFSDSSTNYPSSWSWDFGDGGTSSEQNPAHTYRTPGTYSVTLTASNISGPGIATKTDYITVNSCANQPVRISGVDRGLSIQGAYDNNANEGDVIYTQAVEFIENLTLGRPIQITLSGGYNCSYLANPSDTLINGSLTISDGTVTIENISIQ